MSQAELIRKGQIGDKKQARMKSVVAARTALGALVNAGVYAQDKRVEDVNSAELTAHLETFIEHQEVIKQLDDEIRGLEY